MAFHATLITAPQRFGDHEHLIVSDPGGDRLEVDYNTSLGPWVPARVGDSMIVQGQLYIDSPTQIGVHCVHAHTSSGCPFPGFIKLGTQTYQ